MTSKPNRNMRNLLRLSLLSLLFIVTTSSMGQINGPGIVDHSDAGVARQTIVEQVPDEAVKMQSLGGGIFDIKADSIERFTSGPRNQSNRVSTTGHESILELGYNLRPVNASSSFIILKMIHGHRFSPFLAVGLGTAIKYAWHGRYISIPIFADLRGNLSQKSVAPYWGLAFGYTFDASSRMSGQGVLFNPQLGMRFNVFGNRAVNVGVGYELQKAKYPYGYPAWSAKRSIHSLTLNVGFTF